MSFKKEFMDGRITAYYGDCMDILPTLEKVDAVICDPPYGTTACKWDEVIPFDKMWECIDHVSKDATPSVLFGSEPFSSKLRMSNLKRFKYDWIWEKEQGVGFQLSKYRPLIKNENISVFSKGTHKYIPQMEKVKETKIVKRKAGSNGKSKSSPLSNSKEIISVYNEKLPTNIIKFNRDKGFHPTQKPVLLMRYLIRTYTNKDGVVLDFTGGSGTTAIACIKENRHCIIIEKDKEYFDIMCQRIEDAIIEKKSELF